MTTLVLDVETTVQWDADGRADNTPYHPQNRLVSVGLLPLIGGVPALDKPEYYFLYHTDFTGDAAANFTAIQQYLNTTDLLVCHNAKFDLSWLLEAGFTYTGKVWCTQIGEYVLARGVKVGVSLEDSCIRRKLSLKKSDLISDYFSNKIGFEAVPMDIVQEYGIADVVSTTELFLAQITDYGQEANVGLVPTRDMMNEFLIVLCDMERNGIAIDLAALDDVEAAYRKEREQLEATLQEITREVMGDTPVNFASSEQLSALIYSRRVVDKGRWAEVFNIGKNARGKPLPRPKLNAQEFARSVRENVTLVRKTKAVHCTECNGTGRIRKTKQNGKPYAREQRCPSCQGAGYIYHELKEFGGLRLSPTGVDDVRSDGFATDKDTLELLAQRAKAAGNETAVRFLEAMVRLNAVEVYINSFCAGLRRGRRDDGILHPRFNQCVTSTGRLSSSEPNFQNLPRGSTAPIRRVVVSRWADIGGEILEGDFAGLEFRVAGELSGDSQIFEDVLTGKDVHKQTASIIERKPTTEISKGERQDAKPFTFAPLYGGMGMSYAPHIQEYFKQFMVIYEGVAKWHEQLQNDAIRKGVVTIPSGRQYAFPHARRNPWGGVSGSTQIKNYPVQGFATADIVPCAVIIIWHKMREAKLRSILINTVHDSVAADVYPGERDAVAAIFNACMQNVNKEIERRYNYVMRMPLATELKVGSNWLDGVELH